MPVTGCTGTTTTVYLARAGGMYKPGADNSGANTSPMLSFPVTFGAYDDPQWPAALACVEQLLAPFNIAVTETDPGTAEHIEIVLSPGDSSEIGLQAGAIALNNVSGCSPAKNGIHLIWPNTVSNASTKVCDLVVQAVGFAGGLEFTTACADAMSFDVIGPGCGGAFTEMPQQCGAGQANPCMCGGTTQNSFNRMAGAFGVCH